MTVTRPAIDRKTEAYEGVLNPSDTFARRHIGPSDEDVRAMLEVVGFDSLDALIDATVPGDIRLKQPLQLPAARTEAALLGELKAIASQNKVMRSMIGMGYHGTITPPVILRNILENPLWYTPYTPYQSEIAQGRLEALLNFQTMVADLTALPLANASLLDEATAAAEAMAMCYGIAREKRPVFYVADDCHPQTINVVRTRAWSMGIELRVVDAQGLQSLGFADACGILVQYPTTDGRIEDYSDLCAAAHQQGALVVAACDILALVLLRPPGEWGADIAIGSTQRFGVPMGYGGPHAAYIATHEKHARRLPGRIAGVSKDAEGRDAFRLAIQTREQHIKRDRATSNICTAQVLLAIIAGMYAVWHGPEGLKSIARRVHLLAQAFVHGIQKLGHDVAAEPFFDTVRVRIESPEAANHIVNEVAQSCDINIREVTPRWVSITFDETSDYRAINDLLTFFNHHRHPDPRVEEIRENARKEMCRDHLPHFMTLSANRQFFDSDEHRAYVENLVHEVTFDFGQLSRTTSFLTHPVFNSHHSEHEFLRYVTRLQSRDISLANSMIPLGSCTMKLNAAVEMMPVTWPAFANLHPYAPPEQAAGYARLFADLEQWLCEITGFTAVSLQPNAGSQGEYAGLLAIRRYHESRKQKERNVCLIPTSAHGTNPASAVIAGFRVIAIACDDQGNIAVNDLRAKAEKHRDRLGALMVTYPSTHGVFEKTIREVCDIVHEHGGQVYMDGANMNAQVGLCNPAEIGADVCHLNLHKTFCIPHGGGGPGMGPIGVAQHLAEFLPGDPIHGRHAVSAAAYGSPSILPISWVYIALMSAEGLTRATQIAILSANYVAKRLAGYYPVLYTGRSGTVAHEGIIDCRPFEKSAGVRVEDIAKRLMDYGFHAPTMSWPVAGTMMIEPTESESRAELDRFCDALIAIRREIADIESGRLDRDDNPLTNAPHTATMVSADAWSHPYPRELAAYPTPWLAEPGRKFWPPVARIDNAYGDRNLICTCPSVELMGDT